MTMRTQISRVSGPPSLCGVLLFASLCLCGAPSVSAQQWPTEYPPRPLPAHDVSFPPYEVRTLPNGLQVVVVLHHEQPAVSMRLLIRAGGSSDPKDKLGLARLTASVLDQGTTTKSAEELADAIDFIGGAESTNAGTDLSQLSMIVMKDSFDVGMRMLSDMARHPAFSPSEIDRQRQQVLSGLQVSLEDPDFVANAVFDRLVYGFHPYGMPQTGTPASISAITRDDLVAFHRRFFSANNAILAIVGDVTADEAFNEATKVFGDWEKRDVPPPVFLEPPDPTRRLIVVNKPDAVQTEVRVGHIGVPRKSPDYMALNLAIRILGGEGSNRLHQVLRTERGLTYGAQAQFDTLKWAGDIEAETNTRSEATGEVLRLIVDEFWRLQRERVGERELADAKAYLTGSFPLTIETPDEIALQVLNNVFYEIPLSELQNFRERVNAVTVDDIQRVARAYLKPDRLSVVLVGNAAAFRSQLPGVGFGQFETIELGNLDLTAANFRHDKPAAGGGRLQPIAYQTPAPMFSKPPIVPEEGEKAKALLDRVVVAKGGLETLRAVKTVTVLMTAPTTAPDGRALQVETKTYLQYPGHVRVEVKLPTTTVQQVYDGERGWIRDANGVHDATAPMLRNFEMGFKRDTVSLLVAAEAGTAHPRLLPDVKDDAGRRYQALELSGQGLDPLVLSIDPESGLIAKQTFVAGPGQPIIEEQFADYRAIDGVQVPFTTTVLVGGQRLGERHISDIKINAPIDPALFKRPGH